MTGGEGQILVACIGNIFLGDDGFGVEAARALAATGLPPEVRLVDYGVRGLDLAYALLEPWRAVILVDAIARGGAAGSLYLLEAQNEQAHAGAKADGFNPHAMSPAQVLTLARSLGNITTPIYIVGCEPQDFGAELEGRMGLSAAVAAAVPEAARMVLQLIEQLTGAGKLAGVR
jgi:hydrogenase maturation protease